MEKSLSLVKGAQFDVAIIGGGVTGAALFYELTLRGKRAIIIDRDGFALGTSHNMQRILHGGFRYIQKGDVKRIITSIKAVNRWQALFPHWVKPLEATIPIKNKGIERAIFMRVAVIGYNAIARFYANDSWWQQAGIRHKTHSSLSATLGLGGHGELYFYDAVLEEPKSVCDELIKFGVLRGSSAFEHTIIKSIDGTQILLKGVNNQVEADIAAEHIVFCTGPREINLVGLPSTISSECSYLTGLHLLIDDFEEIEGSVGIDHPEGMLFASRLKDKVLLGTDWQQGDADSITQVENIKRRALEVLPHHRKSISNATEYHQGVVPCDNKCALLERPISFYEGPYHRLITNKFTTALMVASSWADRHFGVSDPIDERPLI